MQLLTEIPQIDTESIEKFVKQSAPAGESDAAKGVRKTRSSLKKITDSVLVEDLTVSKVVKSGTVTVQGVLKEIQPAEAAPKGRKKKGTTVAGEDKKPIVKTHNMKAELDDSDGAIKSAKCNDCKDGCLRIQAYLLWVQLKQKEAISNVDNIPKKIKRERNNSNVLKPVNIQPPEPEAKMPPLPKLKKEIVQASPVALESAQKLSLFNLIREYPGNDPQEFLQFCSRRMQEENYSEAQILTVEQADTDLWHELRKGRITASRIHEASRCTMLSGSLTNKIMGISSGFSFAMKRGTDLEGHVFAVLKREFPSLRNTGLVLDPQFPWMGASPDGLSDDFVLEIKCPYTPKTYECYVDVSKLSKKYFAQIQLQMHMTHKRKALLGVAALDFERSRKVTKVWIDYDKEYVDKVMADAFEFWTRGVFPALLKKRKAKK